MGGTPQVCSAAPRAEPVTSGTLCAPPTRTVAPFLAGPGARPGRRRWGQGCAPEAREKRCVSPRRRGEAQTGRAAPIPLQPPRRLTRGRGGGGGGSCLRLAVKSGSCFSLARAPAPARAAPAALLPSPASGSAAAAPAAATSASEPPATSPRERAAPASSGTNGSS